MATQEPFVSLKLKSLLRLGSLGGFIPWLNIMLARSFCQNEQCHLLRFLCFGKDFADAIGHLNKINFRVKSESFRLSLILFPHPHILQNAFFIYFFFSCGFQKESTWNSFSLDCLIISFLLAHRRGLKTTEKKWMLLKSSLLLKANLINNKKTAYTFVLKYELLKVTFSLNGQNMLESRHLIWSIRKHH